MSALDRILARTMVTDQCWLWLGSRVTKGYGEISLDNRGALVHRIAYEANHGPIPAGMVIDHTCHDPAVCAGGTCVHRLCVNPAHLEAVTNEENLRRQTPAAKTHCDNGHDYTPENTGRSRKGHRFCRICQREQVANWNVRARARTSQDASGAEVREWAREQGIQVGARGSFGSALIDAYNAAHSERPYISIERRAAS